MNLFTSNSIEGGPIYLRTIYNEKLLKSLSSLIKTANKGLGSNFLQLAEKIEDLDANKKLKAEVHTLYSALLDSLKTHNIENVLRLISWASSLVKDPYAHEFSIKTISSSDWEKEILGDLQEQNRYDDNKLPSLESVNKAKITELSSIINDSLRLIEQSSPVFFEEFLTYVSEIRLFKSDRLVGMTDPRAFGTIYLAIPYSNELPPEVYFCEHIIHETSHLHLNTLFAIDQLILNSPEERYSAPIRPDPRPMYGIFHATFVLSRMVKIFKIISNSNSCPFYKNCLNQFNKQFTSGYITIKEYGKLTANGMKIFESYSGI